VAASLKPDFSAKLPVELRPSPLLPTGWLSASSLLLPLLTEGLLPPAIGSSERGDIEADRGDLGGHNPMVGGARCCWETLEFLELLELLLEDLELPVAFSMEGRCLPCRTACLRIVAESTSCTMLA